MEHGMFQRVGLAYSRQLRVWALAIAMRQAGYFFRSRETKWNVMNNHPFKFIFHSLLHVIDSRYMSQAGEVRLVDVEENCADGTLIKKINRAYNKSEVR